MDAAATGSSKETTLSNDFFPISFLKISFASKVLNAGNLSCNFSSFFATSSPIISGLVAKNCPNFINVVPVSYTHLTLPTKA